MIETAHETALLTLSHVADILSVSKQTVKAWRNKGKIKFSCVSGFSEEVCSNADLAQFPEYAQFVATSWDEEHETKPARTYRSIELFAGAGGLALGLEKAGFDAVMLNEWDADACATLRHNRPKWNIVEGDIAQIDFTPYKNAIDLLSGGFPCQAFSYAGKQRGFNDTRGTMFYQFARAIKEIRPRFFLGENVRGLISHDAGRTLATMRHVFSDLGYTLVEPKILKAIFYQVPQKRERLFFVGIRNDFVDGIAFAWPSPCPRIYTLHDALKAGELFHDDCPDALGQKYPERKRKVMEHVPPGGYWRDLPLPLQKAYMKGSFYLGGGKTGLARRLSWGEPSLTLTCAPAQMQTERCHPDETRPLNTREYARIQTFPDDWTFKGSTNSIYKQIGNAVPVNLAYAMGRALVRLLNQAEERALLKPLLRYSLDAKGTLFFVCEKKNHRPAKRSVAVTKTKAKKKGAK